MTKDLENNQGKIFCTWNPFPMVVTQLATALAVFQIIRFIFETNPYWILALDHEALSYPVVFSVPLLSTVMILVLKMIEDTFCDKIPLTFVLYRIQADVNIENLKFAKYVPWQIYNAFIILSELLIQISRKCATWKRSRKRNRVTPVTSKTEADLNIDDTIRKIAENERTWNLNEKTTNESDLNNEARTQLNEVKKMKKVQPVEETMKEALKIIAAWEDYESGQVGCSYQAMEADNANENKSNESFDSANRNNGVVNKSFVADEDVLRDEMEKQVENELENGRGGATKGVRHGVAKSENSILNLSYKERLGSVLAFIAISTGISTTWYAAGYINEYLVGVIFDVYIMSLSIIWIMSKEEIQEFAKLRLHQLKVRFGSKLWN